MFLQHHKPIGEHNPREIVERRTRLDLTSKRKIAQEIFAQALNVGDRQEGRAWADLTVVANSRGRVNVSHFRPAVVDEVANRAAIGARTFVTARQGFIDVNKDIVAVTGTATCAAPQIHTSTGE